VTSVGHRRKLFDAITSLGMAVPAAVVAAPTPRLDGHKSTPNVGS
jgi:hypothetical protein